jgi:hypothetical protein
MTCGEKPERGRVVPVAAMGRFPRDSLPRHSILIRACCSCGDRDEPLQTRRFPNHERDGTIARGMDISLEVRLRHLAPAGRSTRRLPRRLPTRRDPRTNSPPPRCSGKIRRPEPAQPNPPASAISATTRSAASWPAAAWALIFSCPGRSEAEPFTTTYRVFSGKGALFEPNQTVGIGQILDGTSTTIAVVEAEQAVPWTKPDELAFDPAVVTSFQSAGSPHKDDFFASFADGSVRFINNAIGPKLFHDLITRAGGEDVTGVAY